MYDIWKKIIMYGAIGLFIIAVAGNITGYVQHKRAVAAYTELENRHLALEESNRQLREENLRLGENNQRLRELQSRDADTIRRGQEIIGEFKAGIGDSYDTIDRIEAGITALERLIDVLSKEAE